MQHAKPASQKTDNRKKMSDFCLFVSDLHGKVNRYEKLFAFLEEAKPSALFIGGDILPSSVLHSFRAGENKPDFVTDYLASRFQELKDKLGNRYPRIFVIMGNDDPKIEEETLINFEKKGLWEYIHGKVVTFGQHQVMGYSYVPPTPFLLKDWERYDTDHSVQAGCVKPEDGFRTFQTEDNDYKITISDDLKELSTSIDPKRTICLFHSPPYHTGLDRVAMDGISVENSQADIYVGSKAIKSFIKTQQPLLTLHGHIHESSRLTGIWKEKAVKTVSISAAYEGTGLAVVKFFASAPFDAERIIL